MTSAAGRPAGRRSRSRSGLLWLRWSWRDLRARWVVVSAIAVVIALGTGTYAALSSTSAWRRVSNDASFALLTMHDLRVALAPGTAVPEGTLRAAIAALPDAAAVTGIAERLVVPTQLRTEGAAGEVLVAGQIVGTAAPRAGEVAVDRLWVGLGQGLPEHPDPRAPRALLHWDFAAKNGVPVGAVVALPGGQRLTAVGRGVSPEYFSSAGSQQAAGFLSWKSFGIAFTDLATAQQLTGQPGQVNDAVLALAPGTDPARVAAQLRQALAAGAVPLSAQVQTRRDNDGYRVLYDDIDSDQEIWTIVGLLVLGGAAFAAFNLTSRVVEAQRREIGIGMALGVDRRRLAVRPLLFGAQVAILGVLLGLLVGWLVGRPLFRLFSDVLPLPVWQDPVQVGAFARAAAIGFLLPFAGVALPVWRAVRVRPVEAIRVGHLAARGEGVAPLLRRLPWWLVGGRRSYQQMPLRNAARRPRRLAYTALGIGAAVTALVAILGIVDSYTRALDRNERELGGDQPARVTVSLDTFVPADAPELGLLSALPGVARATPALTVPGVLDPGHGAVEVLVRTLEPGSWSPRLVRGRFGGGLVLAQKAAADLGVEVGDRVLLEHSQRVADGFRTTRTLLPVVGLHAQPLRVYAYLDPASAAAFGLAGAVNTVDLLPRDGVPAGQVRRAAFDVPHVASAEPVAAVTDAMREGLQEIVGVLQVASGISLLLALLIAFNSVVIGVEERRREHATMLAFGLPPRSLVVMNTLEALLVGLLATAVGLIGGWVMLRWLTTTAFADVMPELALTPALAAGTLALAVLLSVAAVALAPLLTARRVYRLDVPATLRLVE